ncbi:cardiolipin synthase [Isobaculum melis]|uniref:Cardiolipin synthase n=1 Tax=Isobaculum melis TaxID=142588 RepID=A0A1H9QMH3_9LACT|nr:cardiolipin synthase [Isobaculum melis]SER61654.1 cardiolipin synthase [Isobaculum melis]
MNVFGIIVVIILLGNMALSFAIVFLERKDTASSWAWIFVLNFLPVVGFMLYMLLGRGLSKEKIFDLKIQEKLALKMELEDQIQMLEDETFPLPNMSSVDVEQLIYMNTVYDQSLYLENNEVEIFTDGHEKFDQLLADIRQAKKHVHLQYYIYRPDHLGKTVRDLLIEKAEEGVQVRLIYDCMGSSTLPKKFFNKLREAGGEVIAFFPAIIPFINLRANYRNHRKLAIIDGEISYIGGFNIGDEYLGLDKKYGYWRDTHFRITGDGTYGLQNRFLMDWNSHATNKVVYKKEYFPTIPARGNVPMQMISSGPDSTHEQIKHVYLKMINIAKKEILIQTPYYIPDTSLHDALKLALLSGIKVHLQIPNKPDHMLVYWATYSYAAELVALGAIVETYENGFMHAKTMVIDGEVASVGSANIDIRSFRLNFEGNVIVYDKELASQLRTAFFLDSQKSLQLTPERYQKRGKIIKIKEALARLVAPIL